MVGMRAFFTSIRSATLWKLSFRNLLIDEDKKRDTDGKELEPTKKKGSLGR